MANRKDSKGRVLKTGEYQRANGTYEYKFKDSYGKRRSVYADNLKELREKEKEVQRDVEKGIRFDNKNLLLKDLISEYRKHKAPTRSSSECAFQGLVNIIDKTGISNLKVKDISRVSVIEFILDLNKKYKRSTIKKVISVCRRACKFGVENELISRNPFDISVNDVIKKEDAKKSNVLSDNEFETLISEMGKSRPYSWYIPHLIFLRETGLRISEFVGLRLQDIDLDNNLIHVEQQIVRLNRGPELDSIYYAPLKTSSSQTFVPLSSSAKVALIQIIEKCSNPVRVKNEAGNKELDGFFVLGKKQKIMDRKLWEFIFREIETYYNSLHPDKPIRIRPHTLRHTMVSRLLRKGMSVKGVQRMARHKDVQTTLNVYSHLSDEEFEEEFKEILHE